MMEGKQRKEFWAPIKYPINECPFPQSLEVNEGSMSLLSGAPRDPGPLREACWVDESHI